MRQNHISLGSAQVASGHSLAARVYRLLADELPGGIGLMAEFDAQEIQLSTTVVCVCAAASTFTAAWADVSDRIVLRGRKLAFLGHSIRGEACIADSSSITRSLTAWDVGDRHVLSPQWKPAHQPVEAAECRALERREQDELMAPIAQTGTSQQCVELRCSQQHGTAIDRAGLDNIERDRI